MKPGDQQYWRRRLAEETAAAATTPCPQARSVHQQLAELYIGKLRLFDTLSGETQGQDCKDFPQPPADLA